MLRKSSDYTKLTLVRDEELRDIPIGPCWWHCQISEVASYPLHVMPLCVRWYVPFSMSFRDREEMMAERAIGVDHSTVHRWVIKLIPLFEKTFRKYKRPIGKSWRMDETYMKLKGWWKYLYRAVDEAGLIIDILFGAKRDKVAVRRFF